MTEHIRIPHQAWVLIGDGRKALVMRNEGDEMFPNLQTTTVFRDQANPATAQLGSDRPGRTVEQLSGRRSSVEQTDWHESAEHRFAQSVAATLCALEDAGEISALVVVAPPKTLAELRGAFTDSLRSKIIAEVNKDLTHHPVHEIERLLTSAPAPKI